MNTLEINVTETVNVIDLLVGSIRQIIKNITGIFMIDAESEESTEEVIEDKELLEEVDNNSPPVLGINISETVQSKDVFGPAPEKEATN